MHKNLRLWITLHLTPGFSARAIKLCLEHYSIEEFCQLPEHALVEIKLKQETIKSLLNPDQYAIDNILNWAQPPNYLITPDDDTYPDLLRQIHDPPALLYVRGKPQILNEPQIAIVGSRKATANGLVLAQNFAHDLSKHFIITSGFARGIDSAAHKGASKTVAVFGTGINVIYPRQNKELAAKISENGAIVSEFPLNTHPNKKTSLSETD